MDETGDANRTLVWVTHRTTGQTMIGHSHSGQNSRRAANVEREVGQPSSVYLKRRLYTEIVGGMSHGSMPCLRPISRIVRRLVVTFRKATQIGLQRLEYAEGLCSPNWELEMAVIQLQKDFDDCRTEFELARKHTPAVALRPQRRSGFTSTPVPRYSGKSNWEQYREVFEAIVCSNGWDDVTAALQLLSHLDGDALNVALLVPESRRVVPGFLIKSLSDHYNSPGRLAEYKCQFQRAFQRPGDDPSIFAIELETLARRALIDIDTSIQLQMMRDRFIDGQVECALRRHLDSLGPDTPCCRVWESHRDVEIEPRMSDDRRPARTVCQVSVDERIPPALPETETLEDIIRRLLPTPALPPPQADPIPSDRDILIQRLMGTMCPLEPVSQERSAVTELETMLLNWLPVGRVTEENAVSPNPSADSAEGCFPCGVLTHTTDQCRTLDESFPFLPTGWQAERIGVHPGTESPSEAPEPADGKR